MKRITKILGITVLVIVLLLVAGISLTIGWRPFIGPKIRPLTTRRFESTPARMERGQYLVENIGCFDCHGEHDWTKHDAPMVEGTRGAGYASFPLVGLPGRIVPPNITPDPETGAGKWTDDQLARAIREGIGHDGRALFPLMPYEHYRSMSDEDLASVIVYIRSIPPIHKALPQTEIIFPVKYLIRSVPEPVTQPVPPPDLSTPVARGKYLVTIAGCSDCHTPQVKEQSIQGLEFAGGFVLEGPWGKVASANITPDPSGIPYYDEALFVQTFRTGYVKARKLNPIMGWWHYRNLTDDDLKAMFAYLRTLKPVKHRVDNTESATLCKICGGQHGLGDKN
ncbi:MAG: c-type cytochrome [Terriglobia bacterium]